MKLIIDIPEAAYKLLNSDEQIDWLDAETILEVVARGTPYGEKPTGKWMAGGKDVTGQYFLDEFICNKCFTVVTNESNFCPNCGAGMRGEDNEIN